LKTIFLLAILKYELFQESFKRDVSLQGQIQYVKQFRRGFDETIGENYDQSSSIKFEPCLAPLIPYKKQPNKAQM